MRGSYLALRDVDPETDPTAERYLAPILPGSWDVRRLRTLQRPTWYVRRPNGQRFVIVRLNVAGAKVLYAIDGPKDYLDTLNALEVAPGVEVWRKAQEGPGTARNIMRAYPYWRGDFTERDEQNNPVQVNGVVRRLLTEGNTLPDIASMSLPWDLDADGIPTTPQLAVIRVRVLAHPAYPRWTLAGKSNDLRFEREPDREQ